MSIGGEMKTVLVVAGNFKQFCDEALNRKSIEWSSSGVFIDTNFHKTYIFMRKPEDMMGYHGVEVEFWGTAHERTSFEYFKELAEVARLT